MSISKQYNFDKDESVSRYSDERKIPLIDSSELFTENNEIMIRHEGTIYRVRITKNGKLIMNK
jgi:hemin uptake protein HemP